MPAFLGFISHQNNFGLSIRDLSPEPLVPPPSEKLDFRYKGGIPLIKVQKGPEELNVTIDSGAEINLFREKCRNKLLDLAGEPEKSTLGGLGNEVKSIEVINVSDIRLDRLFCRPMKTGITDMGGWENRHFGPVTDGILGYEFLSQFLVAFNFKKRELSLWELSGPPDPVLVLEGGDNNREQRPGHNPK